MSDALVIVLVLVGLFALTVAIVLWCAIVYSGRQSDLDRSTHLPPPNVRSRRGGPDYW